MAAMYLCGWLGAGRKWITTMIFFSSVFPFNIFGLDHVLNKLSWKKDLKIPSNYCCTSTQPTMLFRSINFLMHRPPVSSLWKCESFLLSFIDKVCIQREVSFHFISSTYISDRDNLPPFMFPQYLLKEDLEFLSYLLFLITVFQSLSSLAVPSIWLLFSSLLEKL